MAALPRRVFVGMPALTTLRLDGNPGAPFTLTLALRQEGGQPRAGARRRRRPVHDARVRTR